MELFTIGFTGKSAEQFFDILKSARIERLVDVRLRNTTQLAGFTKRADLEFFLQKVAGIDYEHHLELAPTDELMDGYRKKRVSADEFASEMNDLLKSRKIESTLDESAFQQRTVLLCSEPKAENCHRRVVAEYLNEKWGGFEITHL